MIKNSLKTKDSSTGDHKHFYKPLRLALTLLFLSLTLYVLSLAYYSMLSTGDYYSGTITVSGHGEVEVKPDIQKLSVDVTPDAPVATNATSSPKVAATTDYAKKVMVYLKLKGISDSDIKILSVRSVEVILRGNNMLNAKSIESDLEKISSKHVNAVLAGAEVENPAKSKARALELALNDAKINAIKVSRSLGADLGKVTSFYDQDSGGDNYDDCYAACGAENTANVSGSLKVTSDISVSFQVR